MKRKLNFIVLTLLFFCFIIKGHGQGTYLSELQREASVPQLTADERVEALLKLALGYRLQNDFSSNTKSLMEARELAKVSGNTLLLTKVYYELIKQSLAQNNTDLAKSYVDTSITLIELANQPLSKAYAYTAKATYYNFLDVRNLAVEHVQKALEQLKKDDDGDLKSRLYYILYGVYSSWDDVALTDKYARMTVQESLKAKNYDVLSNGYAALSIAMEYHYNKTKDRKYLDSMLNNLQKSAELYHQFPGQVGRTTYAIANLNTANYYFKYYSIKDKKVQDEIAKHAELARNAVENHDANYQIRGTVNGLLSELAIEAGNYQMAEAYLMDAYTHVREAETPSYYSLMQIAEGLSQLYEKQGVYEKALTFRKKKEEFDKKIYDENQIQRAKKLEAEFENKALIQEMQVVNERAKSRALQNYLFLGIAILALISLLLLYSSYKNKAKLYEEQRLRLQKEKEEALISAQLKEKEKRLLLMEKVEMEKNAQMQILLEQEERARLQAEQALLQIQKDQMQKGALADALQIERKNELLLELKEKLSALEIEEKKGTVDRIIREEMRNEVTLDKSAKEFQDIHPYFFQKLRDISEGKLTSLDLKYCTYLYLKLSTKEISSLLHVEPKSVRTSKYRIKQKLKLGKEDDLDLYLQGLT